MRCNLAKNNGFYQLIKKGSRESAFFEQKVLTDQLRKLKKMDGAD